MTITTVPAWQEAPLPPFPVRRFTVDEYHRMIEAGVLGEDDRVELLEGWIAGAMPHKPAHDATIDQAAEILRGVLPAGWRLRIQSAITTDDSQPEPDLAVVLGPASRYAHRHPGPADIALLIEVADSSLTLDREVKARLYARAEIVAYWIVNLVESQVEVHAQPSGPVANPFYAQSRTCRGEETLPLMIAGQTVASIAVGDLWV